jgi:hypothetical protein
MNVHTLLLKPRIIGFKMVMRKTVALVSCHLRNPGIADRDLAHTIIDTGGGRTAAAAKGWMRLDEAFVPGAGIEPAWTD